MSQSPHKVAFNSKSLEMQGVSSLRVGLACGSASPAGMFRFQIRLFCESVSFKSAPVYGSASPADLFRSQIRLG